MKVRYINILFILIMLVCACTHEVLPLAEVPIAMKAGIDNIDVQLKSGDVPISSEDNAYIGSVPSAERPLKVDLCFSLTSSVYSVATPTDTKTYLPCHTTATFKDENITQIYYNGENDKTLAYPTTGQDVYCVGFYPQGTWKYSDDNTFKADLTGKADLMFAPQISGKWNQQFGTANNSPVFQHLLTWLKVVICATSYDAIDAWGSITSITLNTAKEIELSPVDNSVRFSEDQQTFELVKTPLDLSILKNEVGSMFIAPTSAPIKVTIKAEDGRIATVDIMSTGGFKPGCQYVMVLYFDSLSVVDALCTLESWENQNDNLYLE